MREKYLKTLKEQEKIGYAFANRLKNISNMIELDNLITDFEKWDNYNYIFLREAFVHKQLFGHWKGVIKDFKNIVSSESFQGKRNKIEYCLRRKIVILKSATNNINSMSNNMDLLPIKKNIETNNQIVESSNINNMEKKLFISHSAKDHQIIKPLYDLIITIGVSEKQIFYSSEPNSGIDIGDNIFNRLKKELNNNILSLFIISENFYKSPVCLCEMGAVWIKAYKQIPILIPPFNHHDIKGVFKESLAIMINDKKRINNLKERIESFFNLPQISQNRWEEKREEYLSKIQGLLEKPNS